MPTPIPFVGPAYTVDSLNINCQRCLNWYPEVDQADSKSVVSLKPRFGLKYFTSLSGSGSVRRIYGASNGRFFGVCGSTVSEIYADGTTIVRGTIASTSGIVRMVDNGLELILVDGATSQGYLFTFSSNTFTLIADTNYPGGSHVAFIDQYFLVNKPNTQQYQWCDLANGASWDGLSVASSEGSPDYVNSLINLGGELWVFGPQSYDVHYSTGLSRGTFARIPGTNNGVGNIAPNSLAKSDTNVFWLGGDDGGHGRIYTNEGYRPRVISTHPIEQAIQRYSKIDDAVGLCYQKLGHDFYQISFPTPSVTWVYDANTGMWHEESFTDAGNNSYMALGIVQDFFNGKVYVGDWRSSSIYEVDPDTYTDGGSLIHRERTSPHIWNNLDRIFYGSFQLDVEAGVGLVSGQGEDPQIMLQVSNDGGHTFGSEQWRGAGRLGEYTKRVKWSRMGSARDRVWKIKCTDPVKWVILGAYIEAE